MTLEGWRIWRINNNVNRYLLNIYWYLLNIYYVKGSILKALMVLAQFYSWKNTAYNKLFQLRECSQWMAEPYLTCLLISKFTLQICGL